MAITTTTRTIPPRNRQTITPAMTEEASTVAETQEVETVVAEETVAVAATNPRSRDARVA